jgi:hypothetical protein
VEKWIEFEKVLKLFESKGFVLQKVWGNYRVFQRNPDELPWLVPVVNGKVSVDYVEKFKQWCDENE